LKPQFWASNMQLVAYYPEHWWAGSVASQSLSGQRVTAGGSWRPKWRLVTACPRFLWWHCSGGHSRRAKCWVAGQGVSRDPRRPTWPGQCRPRLKFNLSDNRTIGTVEKTRQANNHADSWHVQRRAACGTCWPRAPGARRGSPGAARGCARSAGTSARAPPPRAAPPARAGWGASGRWRCVAADSASPLAWWSTTFGTLTVFCNWFV